MKNLNKILLKGIFLSFLLSTVSLKKFRNFKKKSKLDEKEIILDSLDYKYAEMVPLVSSGYGSKYVDGNIPVISSVQAVNSQGLYYDGSANINAWRIECANYDNTPTQCLQNKLCGLCGRSCVPGTPKGPISPCNSVFHFNDPNKPLNAFNAADINLYYAIPKGNKIESGFVKTYTPDMSTAYVNRPYM
ncbi:MAG: hypothetical protein MJ252_12890 [archaeon]|nr:hypothetical protein [archaeon]